MPKGSSFTFPLGFALALGFALGLGFASGQIGELAFATFWLTNHLQGSPVVVNCISTCTLAMPLCLKKKK